ncbi:MAG: hypothetical protein ACR2II_12565 [Chthoniobacterales bacterium]
METTHHTSEQLRADLRYLRGTLERQKLLHRRLLPLPGAIVLGLYILSLCARRDFAPAWQSPWFDLAGYAVLVTLAVYPWVDARRRGEVVRCEAADGVRLLLPWVGLGFAMILLFQIVARLGVPAEAVSALLILLVSLTAFVAGLGGFPTLLGVGLALGAGLVTLLLWPQTGWLLFGALFCIGLIGGALVERRAENQ